MMKRLVRAARTLPELWVVLGLSLVHWATSGLVPLEWKRSLGWTIHPYHVWVMFVALAQFMLAGAMFMRWLRVGGSWFTRLPAYFAVSIGLWAIPGLIVAASARFPIQTVIQGGALLTLLVTVAAFWRELRSPTTPSPEYEAAEEGRKDFGTPVNIGLILLAVVMVVVMTIISFNAPVSNDDNLQLMYAQDNMVVPHINEFEPIFDAGIHPNTRGSLTTWPVNLTVFPYLSGLPPQQAFWILRTLLMLLDLLAFYTLALRLWGKRNQALFTTILYCVLAIILTTDLDGVGFGLFGRTAQDKFVVRYIMFPMALAWSVAFFQKPNWRAYWVAGLATMGQGATHPMGAVLLGIPLGGIGVIYILNNLHGLNWRALWPGYWRQHWPGWKSLPRSLAASGKSFVAENWKLVSPFIFLSIFSLVSIGIPLAAKASPDAPIIAYSLTDTRDPSLFFRINLALNNYRLLVNDAFGAEKYIVHPRVFLTPIIILPIALLPLLFWKNRKSLITALMIGTYILDPIILMTPGIIQRIGDSATPWLLYRFAWPLSLLGPLLIGLALWTVIEWVGARMHGRWPVVNHALPALTMLGFAAAFSVDMYQGLLFLQQVRIDPTASRCRSQQALLSQIPDYVGDGTVILSTVDMDICLPSSVANANTVEYGLTSTINRFPKSRLAEGERRFTDSHEFVIARVVDQNLMNIFARWNVGLILLREDHPLISQLEHLPQFFKLELDQDRYRLYRILPGNGVDILTDVPVKDRWKQALWSGTDPLIEANSLWWDPLESTCRHASLSIL